MIIDQLLEQIKLAQHHRFGVKSEHISPDQLRLFLEYDQKQNSDVVDIDDEQSEPQETAIPAKRAKRGRRKLPDYLPRVEIEHTLSDEACCCEQCLAELTPVSQKITEQLDIVPAQVRVIRNCRQTYQCPQCDNDLTTAPLPPQPIPRSNATAGTLTYLIIAKYLAWTIHEMCDYRDGPFVHRIFCEGAEYRLYFRVSKIFCGQRGQARIVHFHE